MRDEEDTRPTAARTAWLRRYRAGAPAVRLVCFPHAGGTASLFHGWRAGLPDHVELLAVQYPGRQERLAEPCVRTMEEMAHLVLEALQPYRDVPLALFGHSMGAAVAYQVARGLEDRGSGALCLFVSGRGAQHVVQRYNVPHLTDADILRSVQELGGPARAAYDDPVLRPVLLPPLLADYRLLNRHSVPGPVRLRTPVRAYGGDRDPVCSLDELNSWRDCTGNWSGVRLFPGGHFYLGPREAEVVRSVGTEIAAAMERPA
ncbi:thioesterase II family protein [Streptomyces misionensis]|uniref:thioesterase II family protein n=1 Tax=Streptomyces misionensis TaxID=67331 RepID=UPI003401DCC6